LIVIKYLRQQFKMNSCIRN